MADERRKNPDELGALWQREGRRGLYLQGNVTIDGKEIGVVCFRVNSDNPRAPMWRILKSKPREQDERASRQADDMDGPQGDSYE